ADARTRPKKRHARALAEESRKAEAAEDLRARVALAKKRRQLNAKLEGKTLGDKTERDGESTAAWLARTKRNLADTVAKQQQAEDQQREAQGDPSAATSAGATKRDLAGLRVQHGVDELVQAGKEVILTLRDSRVIDQDTGTLAEDVDELENARLARLEREETLNNRKKRKRKPLNPGVDGSETSVLDKYDSFLEEEGLEKKPKGKTSAAKALLGTDGLLEETAEQARAKAASLEKSIQEKLTTQDEESKSFRVFQQMQDYYTVEEYETLNLGAPKRRRKHDKKKKKKKKHDKDPSNSKHKTTNTIKKDKNMLLEGDDDSEGEQIIAQPLQKANRKPRRRRHVDAADIADPLDGSLDLGTVLDHARDRAQQGVLDPAKAVVGALEEASSHELGAAGDDHLVISGTSAFADTMESRVREKVREGLDDEANVAGPGGVSAALKILKKEGKLSSDRKDARGEIVVGRAGEQLQEVNAQDGLVLEYRDKDGNLLTIKEAFREQARRFHGNAPGFRKQEKRRREVERQKRMRDGADADAQARSLAALKAVQARTGNAHVRL
ncbi:U4/U6.U5 tri-snRNP-associated protein 1 (SNU66 homolog) (hSnu66) (Squamous cell carcinoma antigen recognized by T-cells 1) (SART-1) (hSART-1) (U4/U6.U5 tri-snRNP-associated 110 kDa protein) (allergen Hom s 1), partial [Durusdinium trenchii]